jgi:hypothetical protein
VPQSNDAFAVDAVERIQPRGIVEFSGFPSWRELYATWQLCFTLSSVGPRLARMT